MCIFLAVDIKCPSKDQPSSSSTACTATIPPSCIPYCNLLELLPTSLLLLPNHYPVSLLLAILSPNHCPVSLLLATLSPNHCPVSLLLVTLHQTSTGSIHSSTTTTESLHAPQVVLSVSPSSFANPTPTTTQ